MKLLIFLTVTACVISSLFWFYICENQGMAIVLNGITYAVIGWIAGNIFAEKYL